MDSTVKHSLLRRSKLDHVTLSQSRVKKAVLKDCEVRECVITGTEFSGMRMRFGVWKNGRLVGRVGEGEVVFEEIVGFPCLPSIFYSGLGMLIADMIDKG